LTSLKKDEVEEYLRDLENLHSFNFSIEKKGYKQDIAARAGIKEDQETWHKHTYREDMFAHIGISKL